MAQKLIAKNICVPADVPEGLVSEFQQNYLQITRNTDCLMLFAADQKIEHLNYDFYGDNIHSHAQTPEHLFKIAQKGRIGAFATQLGLIARYGRIYSDLTYVAKLNSKTDLVTTSINDPLSRQLWSVEDAVDMKYNAELNICGIGYTIYLGSIHEAQMLQDAAQTIFQAHQHGLVAIVWIYTRGKAVTDDANGELIAGAAGVAAALGADFVKVKAPHATKNKTSADFLKIATAAAGNTKVICSGGAAQTPEKFLHELYEQIHTGGCSGNATGRNIFQRSEQHAIAMTEAISAIVFDNKTTDEAIKIYQTKSA